MNVTVPEGRAVRANAAFSDLTTAKQTGPSYWDETGVLVIPFDREPTAAESTRIRLRLLTRDATEEARFAELLAARDKLAGDTSPYAVALRALLNMQLVDVT